MTAPPAQTAGARRGQPSAPRFSASPPARARVAWVLALLVLVAVIGPPTCWAGEVPRLDYTPGRGLHVADTPLTLGGYAEATLEKPEHAGPSFALEELSLFVIWDPSPQWHFFSETEFLDTLVVEDGEVHSADDPVVQNRLYLDYLHTDALNVRAGKFLTPVGIWNLVHAGPLVWTTSRPIATDDEFFDSVVTGIMLYGRQRAARLNVDYAVYGQATNQLLPEESDGRRSGPAGGGRVALSNDGPWTLGFSSLAFEDRSRDERWAYVGGTDLRWQRDYLELWSEFTVHAPLEDTGPTDWAGYVQATVPLVRQFYGVGRFERVHVRDIGDANLGIVGLDYRPWPTVVIKTEYRFSDNRNDATVAGFAAQLAVLF